MVKLSSSDGREFVVAKEVACQSVLIKNMLEDLGEDSDAPIPLPNVSGPVLEKVVEYATQHKDDAPPAPEDDTITAPRTDDISDWDKEFIKVDHAMLFDIILAANYLDMKGLLDLGCKTVAGMIKGKTIEEIRKQFPINSTEA
ncbi:hypothetical protein HK105_202538 [Polyrhizophydium stewartii]|uniref:E3 ubiquitin ligase complex SCF subunit n=1 Tax=Polyrhizophydium stewartii TaxID=2732419 RepID=A0ABR4NDS4_9FUNG